MSTLPADRVATTTLPLRIRLTLAVEILCAYGAARLELRRGEIGQAVDAMRRTDRLVRSEVDPRRLAQAVTRTLRVFPFDTRCLMASLVVTKLLARRGVPTVFVLAVSPGPNFAAHAWVECDGRPVLPAGDAGFGRLLEL